MKKRLSLVNVFAATTIIGSSLVVSCNTFNQSKWTQTTYGATVMKNTEELAKFMLMGRSENLNTGLSTPANIISQLNDKDYSGQLATVRDQIESANADFQNFDYDAAKITTPRTAMLTAITGDNIANNNYSIAMASRKMNLNYSFVFSYMTDTGPLKTLLASNLGIMTKTDTGLFSNEFVNNIFGQQMQKYDGLKLAKYSNITNKWSDGLNLNIFVEKVDVGKSSSIKIVNPDQDGEPIEIGQNDVKNAVAQNMIKQLRSFNDISRLTSLVSSKNNINNLWSFTNEMFAINNPSNWRIFANLAGVIFSNVYKTVLKSMLFDSIFTDASIAQIDPDFVAHRKQITKQMSQWVTALGTAIGDSKAWTNGRYEDSNILLLQMKLKVDYQTKEEKSLSELLFDLYNSYNDFFKNHSDKIQLMTDVLYDKVIALESLAQGKLQPDWVKIKLSNIIEIGS